MQRKALGTTNAKNKFAEAMALLALGVGSVLLWLRAVRSIFDGWFLWDDSRFLAVAPASFHDLVDWFTTAADDNGYYRPVARALWGWSQLLGAKDYPDFQRVTIALIAGAALFLYLGLSRLFGSRPLALAAAASFALAGPHLKALFWPTVWFQAASCFFAAGSFALFVLAHEGGKAWPRIFALVFLFLTYASNNGMHSWAVVPIAIDFIYTEKKGLRALLKRSRDHLALSLALFTWLYLLNDPFTNQPQGSVSLFASGNFQAFALYVRAAIGHLWGDGPAYSEAPHWLLATTAITIAIFLFGPFFRRRLIAGSAALLGAGFIISLLHNRWQLEYAAPVALAVAILHCGVLSELTRGRVWLAWLLAPAWVYGTALVTEQFVAPPLQQLYLADSAVSRNVSVSLSELSQKLPPGRPFTIEAVDGRLRQAANAHFLQGAALRFAPGRAVFLDHSRFSTGEDFGNEELGGTFALDVLQASLPPLRLRCNDEGCSPESDQKAAP